MVIRYILLVERREAQDHGSDDTTKQEELLQLPSDENQQSSLTETRLMSQSISVLTFIKKRELELLVWTRQRNAPAIKEEKALPDYDATAKLKEELEGAPSWLDDDELAIRTEA